MIDVLLATCRPDKTRLDAQISSILAQRGVSVNLVCREDEAHEGAAANFSALLARSSAPYVALSDQDDVWRPDKLSRLVARIAEIESRRGAGTPVLAFCDSLVTDDCLKPLGGTFVSRQRIDTSKALALPRLLMQNFIAGNLMVFNAALRDKAGAVPPDALMHDCWLALVAAAFGEISFVDEPLLSYRQHGGNVLGATSADARHFAGRAAEGGGAFRRRLARCVAQAKAFRDRFGDETPECVRALAAFTETGYFGRRAAMFRHGLFKQGFLRNAALLLFG